MTTRQSILDEAGRIIAGDRQSDYGPPEQSFKGIADFWQTYLSCSGVLREGAVITPAMVGMMMVLLKVKRSTASMKADTLTDICGYAALLGEMIPDVPPAPGTVAALIKRMQEREQAVNIWTPPRSRQWDIGDNQWHNPGGVEDPGEGWRFLLPGEVIQKGDYFWSTRPGAGWIEKTRSGHSTASSSALTWRTQRGFPADFAWMLEGVEWHNPAEADWQEDGWRFLMLGETIPADGEFCGTIGGWKASEEIGRIPRYPSLTYRTRQPLPVNPPQI